MKLNNAQLNALSNKIAEEIKKENGAYNKVINDAEDLIVQELNLQPMNIILKEYSIYTNKGYSAQNLLGFYKQKYPSAFASVPKKKDVSYSLETQIANDILIKSIEISDLEEIINSIKLKYS